MPELHDHIWILNVYPGMGDLLVVRVDDKATILPPLIIFDDAQWGDSRFERLVGHEKMRHLSNVLWTFTFDPSGRRYMCRRIFEDAGYFCYPQVQFCAILPLKLGDYRNELKYTIDRYKIFKPLETVLALSDLVKDMHQMSDRWCVCRAPCDEHSPSMIRCDNLKCKLDWYHKICVGLDEKFETEEVWICNECSRDPKAIRLAHDESSIGHDENLLIASYDRVHQTKTLVELWEKHAWPKSDTVLSLFDEISCSMDIDPSVTLDVPEEGELQSNKGCWALKKGCPEKMMIVRPADYLGGKDDSTEEDSDEDSHEASLNTMVSRLDLAKRVPR